LRPTYDVAANLGHTQYRLGKLREAAGHLELAVRQWPLAGKKEPKELAAARLAELRRSLVSVRLTVSAPGAVVLVDGERIGTSPIEHEVFLDPGKRTIEARKAGFRDAKLEVEAGKGMALELPLTLEAEVAAAPVPAAPAAGGGGAGPKASPEVRVEEGGGMPSRRTVLIAGGATAGAALVAGVIFTVVANGKASDAEEQREALAATGGRSGCSGAGAPSGCAALSDAFDSRDAFSNAAFWSFLGAGAIGAATVVYAVVTRPAPASTGARLLPVVGSGGGGAVVVGAF
ncbi:MAG: PEGA domain-containing protein, partial [Polyangiaceae bacterium]|nr:PEGA domain-containing protein [Polyangiaceae bacterium]